MLMKNFEVYFNDGSSITIEPSGKGFIELFVDNELFVIDLEGNTNTNSIDETNLKISEIRIVEPVSKAKSGEVFKQEINGVDRYCIICGGRTYCITNGCANTPCGWICD